MIKKIFLTVLSLLVILAGGGYLFRAQLMELMTNDMFVTADTDSFDPGTTLGQPFPPIKAVYQGREIADISEFVHDKGMIFIANRSADW